RRRSDSISVTSWPLPSSSRARFQPTLPAPQTITYTAASSGSYGIPQRGLLDEVDRVLRRADRVQALLGVPVGARRVEHAHDDARHLEAALGDLRDHEVRVVAVGG